jgi:hypothetical protein
VQAAPPTDEAYLSWESDPSGFDFDFGSPTANCSADPPSLSTAAGRYMGCRGVAAVGLMAAALSAGRMVRAIPMVGRTAMRARMVWLRTPERKMAGLAGRLVVVVVLDWCCSEVVSAGAGSVGLVGAGHGVALGEAGALFLSLNSRRSKHGDSRRP